MIDICILDVREAGGGLCTVRFCLWFQNTNAYPNSGAVSAYPDIASDPNIGNASAANYPAALQNGSISEEQYTILCPSSFVEGTQWGTYVEPYIAAILTARKNYKSGAAVPPPQIGLKYKVEHDSVTGWTA